MLKRAIAIAVALLMMLPLLVACQTTAPAATTAPDKTEAPATEAPTEAPATEAPPEAKNLCPYTGDTVTYNAYAADVGVKEDVNSPVYQIYKKAVGNIEIKWELVPFSDFDTKAKLYFNSGEIPDLIWYRSPNLMADYSSSGLFLDFNQYKDAMPNWTAATLANSGLLCYQAEGGEQYIIHGIDNDYPEETFVANKTVLDELDRKSVV